MPKRYATKSKERKALERAYGIINNLWTWSPNIISDADFIGFKKMVDKNLKKLK